MKTPDVILRRGFLSPHNVCISGSGHRRLNPAPGACCKSSSPICSLAAIDSFPDRASKAPQRSHFRPAVVVTMRGTKWQSTIPFLDLRNCEEYAPPATMSGRLTGRMWTMHTCRHLTQPTAPPFPRSFPFNHPSFARRRDFRPPDYCPPQLPLFPGSGLKLSLDLVSLSDDEQINLVHL